MTFSYDQVMHHKFIAYDPATGDEVTPDPEHDDGACLRGEGQAARSVGRGAAAAGHDGAVDARPGRRRSLVGEVGRQGARRQGDRPLDGRSGRRGVGLHHPRLVRELRLARLSRLWLRDARAAQRYEGVPLWLAVGLVDDKLKHGKGAYDAALARKGYKIYLFAADGRSVVLDSRAIDHKNSIILSSKVNGAELPAAEFPMRLVGPGLTRRAADRAHRQDRLAPAVSLEARRRPAGRRHGRRRAACAWTPPGVRGGRCRCLHGGAVSRCLRRLTPGGLRLIYADSLIVSVRPCGRPVRAGTTRACRSPPRATAASR